MTNRHLIDQLADLRKEKKFLSDHEDELREKILQSDDLIGDEHFATLKTAITRRPDRALLEARFGKQAVEQCCKDVTTTTIRIVKREIHEDG